MGRKIPGKKHKGVRDPAKQLAARQKSLKDKVNAPPTNPDEQHIPKSLSRIMDLKQKVKSGAFTKKKKKTPKGDGDGPKKHKKLEFVQRRGETDQSFVRRVHLACETVIQEAAFEKKYGVEIKKNPETGKVEGIVKSKRAKIDELMKSARKEGDKKVKRKPLNKIGEPRLPKTERRKLKLKEKKQKKLKAKVDEFDKYKDNVKFGEIVHEPPNLSPLKKGGERVAPRPGAKDLHLKSLLTVKKNSETPISSTINLSKVPSKVIDRKGKRKALPIGVRRQLDRQQKEIIEAYKLLKERKQAKVA